MLSRLDRQAQGLTALTSALFHVSVLCLGGCSGAPTSPEDAALAEETSAVTVPPIGPVFDDDGTIRLPPLQPLDGTFSIKTLGSRCVDVGPPASWVAGAPVRIRDCARSDAQKIRIRELDIASHDVELRVGSFCLGILTAVRGVSLNVRAGNALQLQTCNGSGRQRFALDGDAILVGTQPAGVRVSREFVIEPQNDFTADGTPLVVGTRELSDAEYFLFESTDGKDTPLTTGFVKVKTEPELDSALKLGWGTVIEIAASQQLWINADGKDAAGNAVVKEPKYVHAGVTIRGNRLRTNEGRQIVTLTTPTVSIGELFRIQEDDVRITGLRVTGPTMGTDNHAEGRWGILVDGIKRVLIDRNELSGWTAAVVVLGDHLNLWTCLANPPPLPQSMPTRVVKNSIHHNRTHGGYGVSLGQGARAFIQGNVYTSNRHSITTDGISTASYVAVDNLFLSDAPDYGNGPESDVNVHGSKHGGDPDWTGGIAGDYFEVGWNTFLGANRSNYYSRGKSCRTQHVHDNVTAHREATDFDDLRNGAFGSYDGAGQFTGLSTNTYSARRLLEKQAVGDFDGDGLDDVFVATGAGWYFSSGGRSEWRFLNRKSEKTSELRVGDFDRDGRADVVAVHGADVVVSWAGISDWQAINVTAGDIDELAVGDFDADGFSDLFYADGSAWYVAPKGKNWAFFATSGVRRPALRFADFTGDGRTDVFLVESGSWMIVDPAGPGGAVSVRLGPAWDTLPRDLFVADFDGDGSADVGRMAFGYESNGTRWMVLEFSKSGRQAFANRAIYPEQSGRSDVTAMGHFDALPGADVLWVLDRTWALSSGASGDLDDPITTSRQDMY